MVALSAAATIVFAQSSKQTTPILTYKNGEFRLQNGKSTSTIPKPGPAPVRPAEGPKISFRKDGAFAVWDARGLSVRIGDKVVTTRFSSAPTDTNLFSTDEAADNRMMIRLGERSANASSLIGSMRFGSETFFLLEWADRTGSPWMHALARADLSAPAPAPAIVARLKGTLLRPDGMSAPLSISQGRLFLMERSADAWGIATWDLAKKEFSRKTLGGRLEQISMSSARLGVFVERTAQGSQVLGRFDLYTKARRNLIESPGFVRLIDKSTPWIAVVRDDTGVNLQNLDTGSRVKVDLDDRYQRMGSKLIVWKGGDTPTTATAYQIDRWTKAASWAAKPATTKKP